jgi:general secretion pathway protein A
LLYGRHGIRENPFGVTPNPRYLYESRTHAEARSSLIVGIECGAGFQALIAPPGMGKTTILLSVLELFKDVARTAFLFQIQGDSRDFLRYLLLDLGCDAHDSDRVRMQDALNQLLIREHRAGRHTIIIIDEAQSLDVSVLETIRLLSNFETPSKKLLQIILAGQPRLAQRLANPELAQLSQRLSILTTLIPFDLEDTRNYIEHRLRIAGYQGPPLFTPAGLRLIWERSRGVPRDINTICFNALLLARQKQIDAAILQEVVADRDLNLPRLVSDVAATAKQETHAVGELTREIVDISHRATPAGTGAAPEAGLQQLAAQPQVLTGSRAAGCSVEEQEQKHNPPSTGLLSSDAAAAEPIASRLEPQAASVANPVEAVSGPIRTEATHLEGTERLQKGALERQPKHWRSSTVVSVIPLAVALLVGMIAIHGRTRRHEAWSARAAASTSLGGAPTTAKKRAGPASVTAIHYFSTNGSTIVEIDLEGEVKYESHRLSSPERIYVDLQHTKYALNFRGKGVTLSELAVSKMRVAERQPGVTRIALETKGFCEYSTSFVSDPTSMLIEIRPAQAHAALSARRM